MVMEQIFINFTAASVIESIYHRPNNEIKIDLQGSFCHISDTEPYQVKTQDRKLDLWYKKSTLQ